MSNTSITQSAFTSKNFVPTARQRWGWYLFDAANSVLIINAGLYIPQWLVVDNRISDFWFNAVLASSSILLFVSGPLLGFLSDRGVSRMKFLRLTSLAMFTGGLLLGIGGRALSSASLRAILGLICAFVILYAYQLSIVFYNVMLSYVTPLNTLENTSGKGFAWGWIGGILSIIFIIPFVDGRVPLFQPASRIQSILPSTLAYGLLTLVSLRMLRGVPEPDKTETRLPLNLAYRSLWSHLRRLPENHLLWSFLLAYFLFSDAILTIENNITIYMEVVHHIRDDVKAYLFLGMLLTAAVGGIISGALGRKFGNRRGLIATLAIWIVLIGAASLTSERIFFGVLFVLMGIPYGAMWNYSRVIFTNLVPKANLGELFGIYSSFERFASVIGPLVWSIPLLLFAGDKIVRYRLALGSMAILVLISLACILKQTRLAHVQKTL
jgi:UMF1 family MFS transporter